MPSTTRGKGWVGTINNCKINGKDLLDQWLADGNIVYGVAQLEKGEQRGTEHLQCYVICTTTRTRKWCNDNLFKGHWELRMGSHEQARDYCQKDETRVNGPWSVGAYDPSVETQKGKSARGGAATKRGVADMIGRVKEGATDRQLLDEFPQFMVTQFKGIERARLILAQEKKRVDPYCVVFYGATGTGKSHKANAIMEANGGGFTFRRGNSGNMWADGYDPLRHPVVVFDEMDGAFMSYRQLLRICDKWQLTLDTKGGAVNFTPQIIIFTSHKHPKEWYSEQSVPDTTELMRRLSGKRGAIIELKEKYVVPDEAGPDLKDVINLLETGELVEQVRTVMEPHTSRTSIDLTCDEELDASGGRDFTDSEEYAADIDRCDQCGELSLDCMCDDSNVTEDVYDDEDAAYAAAALEIERQHATKKLRRTEEFGATSTTATVMSPFKTPKPAASLGVVPPPKGHTAADFKAHKQIYGQSKLSLIRRAVNDDDDDVDDK